MMQIEEIVHSWEKVESEEIVHMWKPGQMFHSQCKLWHRRSPFHKFSHSLQYLVFLNDNAGT